MQMFTPKCRLGLWTVARLLHSGYIVNSSLRTLFAIVGCGVVIGRRVCGSIQAALILEECRQTEIQTYLVANDLRLGFFANSVAGR